MTAPSIPETVRRVMDDALDTLDDFAKQRGLHVNAYGGAAEDAITWQHNYHIELRGYRVSLQVWTNMAQAAAGKCQLQCWIDFGRTAPAQWDRYGQQVIATKDELLREADRMFIRLQHDCLLAMPPPDRPHATA